MGQIFLDASRYLDSGLFGPNYRDYFDFLEAGPLYLLSHITTGFLERGDVPIGDRLNQFRRLASENNPSVYLIGIRLAHIRFPYSIDDTHRYMYDFVRLFFTPTDLTIQCVLETKNHDVYGVLFVENTPSSSQWYRFLKNHYTIVVETSRFVVPKGE